MKGKRKINLGKNKDTVHLIYNYRILKFLERASHRDKSFMNLEQELLSKYKNDSQLLRYGFIISVCNSQSSPLYNTEEFFHSQELNEQATFFRILRNRGELEEAIAELSYVQLYPDKNVSKKVISDFAAHLRNYIGNFNVMKEYKEYSLAGSKTDDRAP